MIMPHHIVAGILNFVHPDVLFGPVAATVFGRMVNRLSPFLEKSNLRLAGVGGDIDGGHFGIDGLFIRTGLLIKEIVRENLWLGFQSSG